MSTTGDFTFGLPRVHLRGDGYFAGEAPASPGDPDGRAKLNDVPGRVRIVLYERGTPGVIVASTLSASDGTWQIDHLDRSVDYTIVGFDDGAVRNADVQDWVRPALMP